MSVYSDYRECPHCGHPNPRRCSSCTRCSKDLDVSQAKRLKRVPSPSNQVASIRSDKAELCLTLGLCCVAMCIMVGVARWDDLKGSCLVDTSTFKTTSGVITISRLNYKNGGTKTIGSYHYDIHFSYSVNGNLYQSDNISFTRTGDNQEFLQEYLRKYPVNESVTVFYQPDNPSFAVLEPENKDLGMWVVFAVFIISLSLLIYGGIIAGISPKQRFERRLQETLEHNIKHK